MMAGKKAEMTVDVTVDLMVVRSAAHLVGKTAVWTVGSLVLTQAEKMVDMMVGKMVGRRAY
jgi:hypothetical protein